MRCDSYTQYYIETIPDLHFHVILWLIGIFKQCSLKATGSCHSLTDLFWWNIMPSMGAKLEYTDQSLDSINDAQIGNSSECVSAYLPFQWTPRWPPSKRRSMPGWGKSKGVGWVAGACWPHTCRPRGTVPLSATDALASPGSISTVSPR